MNRAARLAAGAGSLWRTLAEYLRPGGSHRQGPITDHAQLTRFLDTRASYVAQTSLYGYLRTRAGMRYPELFDDDAFVESINIAKWYVWLACVSDLCVFTGGRLHQASPGRGPEVTGLMQAVTAAVLRDAGLPADAGEDFPRHADQVLARVARCDWAAVTDDEAAFTQSPGALVRHAPIIDDLKALDEPIVRNSVRFRWQEVRRDLRANLDAPAVMASVRSPAPPS